MSVSILLAAGGDGVAAERTLLAIAETTGSELNYEVVVVNASRSTRFDKFLSQVEGAITVVDGDPGLVKSELLGMAADVARSEYLVILDGGVTPGAGWLEVLLDVASGIGERLGIAGCVLVDSSNAVVEAGYVYSDGMVVPVAGLVGFSDALCRPRCVTILGGSDICRRLTTNGLPIVVTLQNRGVWLALHVNLCLWRPPTRQDIRIRAKAMIAMILAWQCGWLGAWLRQCRLQVS